MNTAGPVTVKVNADTAHVIGVLRTVAKHAAACADELAAFNEPAADDD